MDPVRFIHLIIPFTMRPLLITVALCLMGTVHAQLVRQAATTLNLPESLPIATGFTTQNALGSLTFSAPIDVASPPGVTNRLFVVERGAGIQLVNLDTMTKSTFLTLTAYTNSECGLLSLAFHPNYNQNGYFYVFYSLRISNLTYQRVARFQATGTAGNYNASTTADAATLAPIITQRDQQDNHNGGDLAFGPDGYLYISTGDEGAQSDGSDNARRIAKDFLGHILRIDVDAKPGSLAPNPHDESSTTTVGDSAITAGSYRIPPDNPFVAMAQGTGNATYNGYTFPKSAIRTEIYSACYRNPWRMSFDPLTGRLFVADVGQGRYEEINLVTSGFNAGWSWREGKNAHTPAAAPTLPPAGWTSQDPIYEYDHTNDGQGSDAVIHGTSITGGVVYRGDRLPELFGKYLFCDYNTGFIVALTEGSNGTWTGARIATDNQISGWGYDPRNQDALLCDLSAGQVKRLARSGTSGTAPPLLLSQTGVFSDLATLTPQAGLVPYAPNVPFWSDHAIKSRWFAIKNLTDTFGFSQNGNWTFPTGMTWIKHFDINTTRGNPATRRKLETRIIVKTATEIYGLTYKWRADQSDADLVPEQGLTELIPASSPAQTWRYPSRTECRVCHTDGGGLALSFNTPQLNRTHPYGTQTPHQIEAMMAAGYITPGTAPTAVATLPKYAAADDATSSLEWRVRSYLAVNCAQCHQPGGAAVGNWDARATTPTDAAQLINGLLVNDGGDPLHRWCIPGDTSRSMILKRLSGIGANRMPPLGTTERDLAAEQLLTEWINAALPTRQSFSQWQLTHFPSTSAPDAQGTANPDGDGQNNQLEYLLGTHPLTYNTPYQPTTNTAGNAFSLSFTHPANRSVLIETSTNLQQWSLWNVPGNAPFYPASSTQRVIQGVRTSTNQYFRLRIAAP
jgi:glucose/arabinose dehydrogenase/mono/diheme cytochrome c family protein